MTNPLLATKGIPQFSQIKPEHVEAALDETLRRNREELEQILNRTDEPSFADSIAPVEEMGDRLHRTWAPVSHLHGVANSDELRKVYNACLPKLSRYSTELAQNEKLFEIYRKVDSRLNAAEQPVEKHLLEHALREFRLAGVALPTEQKARFKAVMEELSQLQARFEQNLLDSMKGWSKHLTDAADIEGIPVGVLAAAEAAAAEQNLPGWLLHLDQPTYVGVVTYADNASLREEFYAAWVTRASDQGPVVGQFDNTALMEDIMRLRHEAANLVGFANYAEYALASRMAGSVREVTEFLEHLATVARPAAVQELDDLQQWSGTQLKPWDVGYYAEKLRMDRFSISDEELRPYFPLARVMDGLFGVMQKLYGIRAVERDNVDRWQPDVRYYALLDDQGHTVGGFFMDLFARRNKRPGAWMDECLVRKRLNGNGQQIPVGHLICNFSRPADGKPALLSHDEILTLFHEFGHNLHHLLTKIDYPSVSGINGVPWDAVELPSQFMENFAWDAQVLRSMSQHVETGVALPDDLLAKLEASRVFQSGMHMMKQLEFALFDWRIHAEYSPEKGARIYELMAEVRKRVAVLQAPSYSRFPNSFAHVFGGAYAAGYYSYKWAEVLAADAFAAFQEVGLFDRAVADRFRSQILEVGGAADIGAAFAAFRGRPPTIDALLAQSGIVVPASASPGH
jgi:oligopeptidase A